MLKKPNNYDEIQLNEDFTPIALGGHKGIIMSAEEYENEKTGNKSIKVCIDTDKDDAQPSYFAEMYKNDDRPDKKWSNQATKYVSLRDDENCIKMLKGFITAIENSNKNFTFNWDKELDQLKGKKIGLIFALEEYTNQQGETKTIAKVNQFRSIDKVDGAKIPKVKLLDGSFIEYDEYKNGKSATPTNDAVEIVLNDGELPF